MLPPWQKTVVVRVENETQNTRRFWIQFPETAVFDFLPGQFVTMDLPIHNVPSRRARSYSIASWPNNTNIIELIIVHKEGGTGTEYLFNKINVGSELQVRGPMGNFLLPATMDKDLFLICTGTGIAPFRSMIHYIHLHKLPHQAIYLIFGCRRLTDALYADELREMESLEKDFYYFPVFSRETEAGGIYRQGYVHPVYEEICKSGNFAPADFYLCGWKDMIREAKERIQKMGYSRKSIHQELYG